MDPQTRAEAAFRPRTVTWKLQSRGDGVNLGARGEAGGHAGSCGGGAEHLGVGGGNF